MKLLLLSFYYKPDLCAGSFRCSALVDKLKAFPDIEIELVTTLPNRYASFSEEAPAFEEIDNLRVHRIALPGHNSGIVDQAKAFKVFYLEALKVAKGRSYDGVYATSSRLFTAFLGARISRKIDVPLYLDIRDIFVDTINDVMSKKVTWIAKPVFSLIEKYTFETADRINLVSPGFKEYFEELYPQKEYRWFTNGIDNEFIDIGIPEKSEDSHEKILSIVYAGNIGEGQGLHTIVPELAKRLEGKAIIKIIGDGGKKPALQEAIKGMLNVEIEPPVKRKELISIYQKADVLFLHLNDYDAFKKVLPSKIFEYAALGKPILAGVAGYAAEFLRNEVTNCAVFDPGDSVEAEKGLSSLDLKTKPRHEFVEKFSRDNIMSDMSQDIVSYFRGFTQK